MFTPSGILFCIAMAFASACHGSASNGMVEFLEGTAAFVLGIFSCASLVIAFISIYKAVPGIPYDTRRY